jgi:hypothetical protein
MAEGVADDDDRRSSTAARIAAAPAARWNCLLRQFERPASFAFANDRPAVMKSS